MAKEPLPELIAVKHYRNRFEAELDKSLLEANGIPCFISAEDAGGMRPPPFQFDPGARLIVRSVDLIPARRLLRDS